jgi:predicted transcriptional regulator
MMDWNLVSFVTSGKLRFKILIELNKSEKIPSELSSIVAAPISHISRSLKELENEHLIQCLTQERRKNKFYQITTLGKEILEFINKETKTD